MQHILNNSIRSTVMSAVRTLHEVQTVRTSELTGRALDWAVAYALGFEPQMNREANGRVWRGAWETRAHGGYVTLQPYSTEWDCGGPVIERHISKLSKNVGGTYTAQIRHETDHPLVAHPVLSGWTNAAGPTMLVAAMRAFVMGRGIHSVDIPVALLDE